MDVACLQAPEAANRVAPIGISAVDHDVARVEVPNELVERAVDGRPRGHVKEHHPGTGEPGTKIADARDAFETRLLEIVRRAMSRVAHHPVAFLDRLAREAAAHAAKADHAEFACAVTHGASSRVACWSLSLSSQHSRVRDGAN